MYKTTFHDPFSLHRRLKDDQGLVISEGIEFFFILFYSRCAGRVLIATPVELWAEFIPVFSAESFRPFSFPLVIPLPLLSTSDDDTNGDAQL